MDAANLVGQTTVASSPRPRPRADRGSIQSVDRALTILNAIAETGGETTLTELSGRIGLNISTCHHLLATLMKWGYVTKAPGKRSYMLGARTVQLGLACLRQVDLPRRAQPYLERINNATGEMVNLAVLQGDHLVTLVKREGRHAVRVDTGTIGQSDAVHATAAGKAMLAWLPEDQIRRIVMAQGMKQFTPATITDFSALIEELRLVRRNGFALDREELIPDVLCVGAAVRDHAGAVVGAISTATPAMRATEEHLARMRDEIISATRALSAELGAEISQAAALDQPNSCAV